MARLYRPHIPLSVRVQVATRQLDAWDERARIRSPRPSSSWTLKHQLAFLLDILSESLGCDPVDLRLDHDPALCNRKLVHRRKTGTIDYDPPANDPSHLLYRTKAAHDIKTRVRGDGAQHSDLALRRIAKRRAAKAGRGKLSTNRLAKPAKRRNKQPWPSRPMPKGRGFPKRRG